MNLKLIYSMSYDKISGLKRRMQEKCNCTFIRPVLQWKSENILNGLSGNQPGTVQGKENRRADDQ